MVESGTVCTVEVDDRTPGKREGTSVFDYDQRIVTSGSVLEKNWVLGCSCETMAGNTQFG